MDGWLDGVGGSLNRGEVWGGWGRGAVFIVHACFVLMFCCWVARLVSGLGGAGWIGR